jgi:sugar-specific transcriptional regulator TrmB
VETDELETVLEDAGLSPYQAAAYVTALDLGTASATELAEASDVPDPRIYDVIRDLEARGYIETYEHGSLRIRAHSPAETLEDLQSKADRYEAAATEIEQRWEQPELESHAASIVKRFDTVIERARTFIREATTQIRLSARPTQIRSLRPDLEDAFERGVHVHLSVFTQPDESTDVPDESFFEGVCTEARHRRLPSPFVVLVDRSKACFSPNPLESHEYGVLVDDRIHEYIFHWYFVTCLWELADLIYTAGTDGKPSEYVDLRRYIRDIDPLLQEGATITTTVEGFHTDTGEKRTIRGTVTDVYYEGQMDSPATLAELAGKATVTLDTGDQTYTVGGWGASLEELEASVIRTESIDRGDECSDKP